MKFIGKELIWSEEQKKLAIEVPIVVTAQACYIRADFFAEKELCKERYEVRLDVNDPTTAWRIVKRELEDGEHKLLTLEEARAIVQKCASDVVTLSDEYHLDKEYKDVDVRVAQFNDGAYYDPEYEDDELVPIKVEVINK